MQWVVLRRQAWVSGKRNRIRIGKYIFAGWAWRAMVGGDLGCWWSACCVRGEKEGDWNCWILELGGLRETESTERR